MVPFLGCPSPVLARVGEPTGLVSKASAELDVDTLAASTLVTSTEPCAMCRGAIH